MFISTFSSQSMCEVSISPLQRLCVNFGVYVQLNCFRLH
ncbi:unnamed protein product [Chondrus crispus]|uniref:Uncharacterized protein n=1 Tax=Chondrus crispus TaxID=2769 RepID=R7Q6R3_CHOCR|nr:unnamed protein product [Chondrus crispus]XP_005712963.1 unnamed protein product [Chondrus crispus]CDF33159.1 unnamed protein product [Chondrus crispus]CDF33160.1 unnamed protein product [Chondrus crispus]|eukprot:XP_005712962.1 unnamed protein product [Chondrus crispus]